MCDACNEQFYAETFVGQCWWCEQNKTLGVVTIPGSTEQVWACEECAQQHITQESKTMAEQGMYQKVKIVDSWRQIGGGTRYLLRNKYGDITIDISAGQYTGFCRPGYRGDKVKGLQKAFRFLQAQLSDEA